MTTWPRYWMRFSTRLLMYIEGATSTGGCPGQHSAQRPGSPVQGGGKRPGRSSSGCRLAEPAVRNTMLRKRLCRLGLFDRPLRYTQRHGPPNRPGRCRSMGTPYLVRRNAIRSRRCSMPMKGAGSLLRRAASLGVGCKSSPTPLAEIQLKWAKRALGVMPGKKS